VANINRQIAEELGVREQQISATVELLDGGATVPFVARYRKEITGGLDDAQLRTLEERLTYLRELEERRVAILNSVREQGKLDAALEAAIMAADSKGRLEDIYLPFKPKRRTKAEIAKEAGLEPLSELLLTQPQNDPQAVAATFVDAEKQVADVAAALEGARAILVERFAEDADLIGSCAKKCGRTGVMTRPCARARRPKARSSRTISTTRSPPQAAVAPHSRAVSRREGRNPRAADQPDAQVPVAACRSAYELKIMQRFAIPIRAPGRPLAGRDRALGLDDQDPGASQHRPADAAVDGGGTEGVRVFASNLRDLLLAAPAGARVTMGSIPASAPACKVAVVDATGKVVADHGGLSA
jgi:uncharacterized protein